MIRHLYVHVPFCLRRCSYCDFAVQAVSSAPTDAWLDAIGRELAHIHSEHVDLAGSALDTIYVGGGTPSLIGGAGMRGLRERIENMFRRDDGAEWTAEANPETLTEDVASDWRQAGVNRISLGVQTFDEDVLRWMGRMHGAAGPARAVKAARSAGFDNLSLDLIFGLPARFDRDWKGDLERIIDLEPEHVSLYGLTAEKATPLGRWVAEAKETLAGEEQYVAEYLLAVEMLTAAGFEHYEVSNFGLPGRASRHNQAYWVGVPYLGLGPGAHSFLPPARHWNVRDWRDYAARLNAGQSAREGAEVVEADTAGLERAWLGLRTSMGLQVATLSEPQLARLGEWQQHGLAMVAEGTVRLTAHGWLLLDRLVVELVSSAG
ncbi:MAG TPA: radical SAM family heme chaperone HemW [Longimicrobiales bacterium]